MVVAKAAGTRDMGDGQDAILKAVAGQRFYNTSPLTLSSTLSDNKNLAEQLAGYIRRLSKDAYAVMEANNLDDRVVRMDRADILYARSWWSGRSGDVPDLLYPPDARAGCWARARYRDALRASPSATRSAPMPSSHTSLLSPMPSWVGQTLPGLCIPGVRR